MQKGWLSLTDRVAPIRRNTHFALIDLYAEASRIWKAISQLSDEQQKLITEVFINGKKKKEYAEEIGISGAAVSQRINTIRKKLKKLL